MGRKRYFSSLLGSAEKPLLLPLCGRKGEGARLVMGRKRYFSSLLGSAEKPLLLPLCGRKGEGHGLSWAGCGIGYFPPCPYEEGVFAQLSSLLGSAE
jgi:hypothetical protein